DGDGRLPRARARGEEAGESLHRHVARPHPHHGGLHQTREDLRRTLTRRLDGRRTGLHIRTSLDPSSREVRMRFVAWLDDISRGDTPLVGGKGANLGEMRRAGLPVPPGFVVTVDAFRAYLRESDLQKEIEERLRDLSVDDPAQLDATSAELQSRIRRTPLP